MSLAIYSARQFRILPIMGAFALAVFCSKASPRQDVRLDAGWRFQQGDAADAERPGFDDHAWHSVTVPHNWGWQDAQLGRDFYRGPGWYRRELDIPTNSARRFFLRFDAASTVADVYLNGKWLGQHRGGFGAFAIEITRALSINGANCLAVRVSNAPEPDIAPLSGDFSVYGGLYRPVHLIETSVNNICLTDHGSPGVAWLQSSVSSAQASLDVTAQISNPTSRWNVGVTCVARVLDTAGNEAARATAPCVLAANVTAPVTLHLVISNPHLWNGIKDPYLYKAVLELYGQEGLLDSVEQPLGLRYYHVDAENGFFLNGQPYPVHGVNRHQERFGKGWAISEADQDEDIRLIREMGCTAIRCCHYQQSDYFYSLCDKAGILVWAELPQVNEVRNTAEFSETSRNQWLDLIRQNINHPSIFVWSMFNEMAVNRGDPHRILQDLRAFAHGEDPTRPTIAASDHDELPQMNRIPDLLGWNFYPGWYRGRKEDLGRILDEHRDSSRSGGFCVSEYGAGANVNQHEENPAQPVPAGQWHPEEWQALLHESAWPAIKSRRFVWGAFPWVMFDFAVNTRHEGGVPGRNDKGLVTADRQVKKDAFFYYKANWSDQPVLYITSRRFAKRTNSLTSVKIYSNAQKAELFINGVSCGTRPNDGNAVFIWKNISLVPGQNIVEARAQRDGQSLNDRCEWMLNPGSPREKN
jgi:beta-galactosidase